MTENFMTIHDELRRISRTVERIRGWDFAGTRTSRDPTPWSYHQVVRRYLSPADTVLDIGTGGGERFLELAPYFAHGMGIDASPAMIQTAHENLPPSLVGKMSFQVMRAQELDFPASSFDVVLSRHAPVFVEQIAPLLRPGGYFITQQVAGRNLQSIFTAFGWGSNGERWQRYWREHDLPAQDVATLAADFTHAGCAVVARGEFDVPFYFEDMASLVFYLKALPFPEVFDVDLHWEKVARLIADCNTARGIASNEHRELLVVRKR